MKVYFREYENIYTFYTKNDKDKENQVPKEQCTLEEFRNPSPSAIAYWKHYGIDRTLFDTSAIKETDS